MLPHGPSGSRSSTSAPSRGGDTLSDRVLVLSGEISVGTQVTCTFADDNGYTPAFIKVTLVDGSEYELSVSVP